MNINTGKGLGSTVLHNYFYLSLKGDFYIFRRFLRKEDGVVICKVTLTRICILKLEFFRSWCVFEEGSDHPFIFLHNRYSVFQSEARIFLGFSQIKTQNMLKL